MYFVFDSTSLIHLAKTSLLEKFKQIKGTKIIPANVFEETVKKGLTKGEEDARIIEKLVKENVFVIKEAKNKSFQRYLLEDRNLHKADAETLSLGKELKAIVLMDEEIGRTIGEIEKIQVRGSIYCLFLLLKNKLITKKELIEKLDEMIENGWHCSTGLYALILRKLREVK